MQLLRSLVRHPQDLDRRFVAPNSAAHKRCHTSLLRLPKVGDERDNGLSKILLQRRVFCLLDQEVGFQLAVQLLDPIQL